ncbi:MAG: LysE family translocator [Gammaproteobacteria bacterium]|nr:LysE family translocator [Gammaproteobacteria bacterium]
MEVLFFSAFVLGLIFNAAPGAVFAETVKAGVRGGFKSALAVQIGSLVGDATWAILGLIGVGLLLQLELLQIPIGIAGAFYLTWLAYDSWSSAKEEFHVGEKGNNQQAQKALRAGVILSITNPQNIAYWAAIGSALSAVGIADPVVGNYITFFAGFMASSLVWCFFCAAVVDRVFRKMGARWARVTYRLCAIAFLILALNSIRNLFVIGDTNKAEKSYESPLEKRNRTPSLISFSIPHCECIDS